MMLVEDEAGNIQNFSLMASTSSMVRKMEKKTNESWDGVRIFEEANAGNALCKQVIKQFYHNLAMGVFNVQHTLYSEMILFGGAISQRDDFVERLMEEYNIIREKMGMDVITPNLKCCTYRQDANLLVHSQIILVVINSGQKCPLLVYSGYEIKDFLYLLNKEYSFEYLCYMIQFI